MKTGKIIIGCMLAVLLVSCANIIHDLVPPDDDRIVSFKIPGQTAAAAIDGNTVMVTVAGGTDVCALLPTVTVSNRASLFPVTLDYVQAAFPSANLVKETMGLSVTNNLASYAMDLIMRNRDFDVPALDMPIDFSGPVIFFVVSAIGTVRQFTVYVPGDPGYAKLLGLRFSKYDNPELVSDGICLINEAGRSIYAEAAYPAEMTGLSFALIPSFVILGDRLEIDGVAVQSGVSSVLFTESFGTQNRTLTVWRNGASKNYTLSVNFAEDPDTVRSITDFRFNRTDNPDIAVNAVASIVNEGSLGTITVQVLYSGAKPSALVPKFVSPGTVTVGGMPQTSGAGSRDFSQALEYYVVSRNGLYRRTYTVKVEYISLGAGAPRIQSFRLSAALNPDLLGDAVAEISDGNIMIEARYLSASAPASLVPEFSAEGMVTVYGSVQVSGASGQDFSRQMTYTVSNPENPQLSRDYRVQTRLVRENPSDAVISSFGFYRAENPGLGDDIVARIDQSTGSITVYAPVGSGVSSRTMYPRFSAAGQVSVSGVPQVSGVSGMVFNSPVTYTVVSANRQNTKNYTVTVRELKSTIDVNRNATGYNDGTSWQDAFVSLKAALEAASEFPEDMPKEIWIAAGTYTPGSATADYIRLLPNASYIGGFAGWETAKSQRSAQANKVIISGDLGGGRRANNLFGNSVTMNRDIAFEDLTFTGARALSGSLEGAAINAALGSGAKLSITGCVFSDLEAENAVGAISIVGSGSVKIIDTAINSIAAGTAIYSEAGLEADSLELTNITGWGIYVSGGDLKLSGISARDISGYAVLSSGLYSAELKNSVFESSGSVGIGSTSTTLVTDTKIINGRSNGLSLSGKITVERVTIDGTNGGGGISASGSGTIGIYDSVIRNCKSPLGGGGGISINGSGTAVISNTIIENVEAYNGGAMMVYENITSVNIIGCTIRNTRAAGRGGALDFGSNAFNIVDTDFVNCSSSGSSQFIYSYGTGTFLRCSFIHEAGFTGYSPPDSTNEHSLFLNFNQVVFENCEFTNLTGVDSSRETYFFNRWAGYPAPYGSTPSGGVWHNAFDLILRNCTINLRPGGKMGLMAMYGRDSDNDRFLMDGVTINGSSSQPLFWLHGSGIYQFRLNNVYNGTMLSSLAAINGLESSGVIRRTNGAVIVP
jgi:hypothetical protein